MRRLAKKYVVPHRGNEFRPYLLRATGLLILFVFIIGALFASNTYRVFLKGSDLIANVLPAVLIDLANANRSAYELGGLTLNLDLQETARLKAEDMATKGYFAHDSPLGISPWHWFDAAGYTFVYAGENLAINFDDSDAVSAAWMNSPSHRANILNDRFTEVGIATARGMYEGRETLFVVEMFGRPAPIRKALPVQIEAEPKDRPPVATPTEKTEEASRAAAVPPRVLGEETGSQMFVSVQDANAAGGEKAAIADSVPSVPRYAPFVDRWLTSPTKLLSLAYTLVITVLLIVLLFILVVRHKNRGYHLFYLAILFLIIGGTYYAYKFSLQSKINLSMATTAFSSSP